ncbi:hypothetical protein [Phenylobacterium sp.]|uniref:hypothetical protein n=1 Tax=Phenylobacterium sp. TaxID=1871053 RepID=UPI002F415D2A
MKLKILATAVAALALAGVAVAQQATPPYVEGPGGSSPPRSEYAETFRNPSDTWSRHASYFNAGDPARAYSTSGAEAAYRQDLKSWKLACASDRETLCQGRRDTGAVYECLRIRRSKLSDPCRTATYAVERAAVDAYHFN